MTPRLHYFDRVSSTMDVLHELAAGGAEAGSGVLAGEQLEGRGSRGRSWHSPPGGLWLSVLFRPAIVQGLEVVSLRAGLAVAEAMQPLVPEPLQLKWPNDLILRGRKLGGMLCEARWQGEFLGWVAVGVGLNVQNPVTDDLEATAVSLAGLGMAPDLSALTDLVVAALRKLELNGGELSPSELRRFAARDCLRGRAIREPVAGIVQGLSADGALMVQPDTGPLIALRTGSVTLADSLTAGNFDHVARTGHR
jgi:BirA family transcriptional regulator, biotin operon repressor / biotin---[acetyl-CoA-carboxylase] ligase